MQHPTIPYSQTNETVSNPVTRHLVILPTPHEDVLRLKEKLLIFQNRGWQVKDFGAFGAFE